MAADCPQKRETSCFLREGSPAKGPGKSGFTLVELLVVISIIGLLLALLLPAVNAARASARRAGCINHQRQLVLAINNYESGRHRYPPGRIGCDDTGDQMDHAVCPANLPAEEKSGASGFVAILPFLEEQALFDRLDFEHGGLWNRNVDDLGWYADPNKCQGIKERPAVFACPSDPARPISEVYVPVLAATTSYALVQGSLGPDAPLPVSKFENDGLFIYVEQRAPRQVTDGLSQTLATGEVVLADTWESSNTWSYALVHADCLRSTRNPLNTIPGDGVVRERQNGAFGSHHAGGAMFGYADSHVAWLSDDVDPVVYQSLSTIRERNAVAGTRSARGPRSSPAYPPSF